MMLFINYDKRDMVENDLLTSLNPDKLLYIICIFKKVVKFCSVELFWLLIFKGDQIMGKLFQSFCFPDIISFGRSL